MLILYYLREHFKPILKITRSTVNTFDKNSMQNTNVKCSMTQREDLVGPLTLCDLGLKTVTWFLLSIFLVCKDDYTNEKLLYKVLIL